MVVELDTHALVAHASPQDRDETGDLAAARIMIVDDVPVNINVLQAHLANAGFTEFVTLTDASQAIATVSRNAPDILLLDVMMPVVSGLDILAAIRSDEAHVRLPVLILTASATDKLRSDCGRSVKARRNHIGNGRAELAAHHPQNAVVAAVEV